MLACIIPLLNALGWRAYQRELIEALPHFVDHIDLTDLRNLLVTLGYESDESNISLERLNDDLLPALFVGDKGEVWVVLEKTGKELLLFDGNSKTSYEKNIDGCKGDVYVFTDMRPTHALPAKNQRIDNWFGDTVSHFKEANKAFVSNDFYLECYCTCSTTIYYGRL